MKSWSSNTRRWLRILHRDIGYVMVGICLVYGISGILLNHMNGQDPSYKSSYNTIVIPSGLDREGLMLLWNSGENDLPLLKRTLPIDEQHTRLLLDGGIGVYSHEHGIVDYEIHKKRQVVYWLNRLHYNKVNGWSVMADVFAVSLIFFAISGLLMVRGKKGLAGRGKWFLLIGLLIPVCYIIFS